MSNNHNEYLRYTEYYIIRGAYHIVNVVNEILTHSACYSVNIKEYLRNQVVLKQVALNEMIRNQNVSKINNNNLNDDDIDEDGFVIIKMRRPKKNKTDLTNINSSSSRNNIIHDTHDINVNVTMDQSVTMDQNKYLKSNINNVNNDIIQQIVESMIKDVITKLHTNTNISS